MEKISVVLVDGNEDFRGLLQEYMERDIALKADLRLVKGDQLKITVAPKGFGFPLTGQCLQIHLNHRGGMAQAKAQQHKGQRHIDPLAPGQAKARQCHHQQHAKTQRQCQRIVRPGLILPERKNIQHRLQEDQGHHQLRKTGNQTAV